MTNFVLNTIEQRHCKRSYIDKGVPLTVLKEILTVASNAPSSKNTQPWQVAVVQGNTLKILSQAILQKFDNNDYEKPDFQYTLMPIPQTFLERAKETGYALFDLKGIDRNNFEQRRAHQRENYLFFGATTVLIFLLPKNAERGNFLDMGFYIQNVMLGLYSVDISSCPQFTIAEYPHTIRKVLQLPDDLWVVCGLACGYADTNEVNSFIPPRLPLSEFARFYD